MAIDVRTLYAILAGSTSGNDNGGGFNPFAANFPTDLATTTGTSATPTVSAAYAFTANDVSVGGSGSGAWIYVKFGTNWIQGFYQILSQSGGVATINAAVGAAVIWDSTQQRWKPSTAQGCCTQATPGGNATYGVDYSQSTAAAQTSTTAVSDGAANSVISGGGLTYGTNLIGNLAHIMSGTGQTVGWYHIDNANGTTITLDRDAGSADTITKLSIGGAFSLNSAVANQTDDAVFELGAGTNATGGSIFFVKGSLSLGGGVSITTGLGGTQAPVRMIGFNAIRGDSPTLANSPTIAAAGNIFVLGTNWEVEFVKFTGSSTTAVQMGSGGKAQFSKFTNTSTTAARSALLMGNAGGNTYVFGCEAISYRGPSFQGNGGTGYQVKGCWGHDSDKGLLESGTTGIFSVSFSIFESNVTAAIHMSGARTVACEISNCTLYGGLTAKTGTGILFASGTTNTRVVNTIIAGFATGIVHPDVQTIGFGDYNNFYNNTVDVAASAGGALDATRWPTGQNSKAINPQFANVGQVTGTTGAFRAGNDALIDTTKNFTALGVVAGVDHVYMLGNGTGDTAGIYAITAITTTTNPNDTLVVTPAPGTSTATDKDYQITTGHNFAVAA